MATASTQSGPQNATQGLRQHSAPRSRKRRRGWSSSKPRQRRKKAEAEINTINSLKTAKQDIDRKLQDLKTTHDTHTAHAKANIYVDVAKFKTSVDALSAKFKTSSKK